MTGPQVLEKDSRRNKTFPDGVGVLYKRAH